MAVGYRDGELHQVWLPRVPGFNRISYWYDFRQPLGAARIRGFRFPRIAFESSVLGLAEIDEGKLPIFVGVDLGASGSERRSLGANEILDKGYDHTEHHDG